LSTGTRSRNRRPSPDVILVPRQRNKIQRHAGREMRLRRLARWGRGFGGINFNRHDRAVQADEEQLSAVSAPPRCPPTAVRDLDVMIPG
jgi:hypothetical protein